MDGNIPFSNFVEFVETVRVPLGVSLEVSVAGGEPHTRGTWDSGPCPSTFRPRAGLSVQQGSLLCLKPVSAERALYKLQAGVQIRAQLVNRLTVPHSAGEGSAGLAIENTQICKLQRVSYVPSQARLVEIPQT